MSTNTNTKQAQGYWHSKHRNSLTPDPNLNNIFYNASPRTNPYTSRIDLQNINYRVNGNGNGNNSNVSGCEKFIQLHEAGVNHLQSKAKKLSAVVSHISKIQDFYQIMCMPFQNNNEKINERNINEKNVSVNNNNSMYITMNDNNNTEQISKIALRCYEHNNQLILYCVNDHKLLCANCMFGQSQQQKNNNISNSTAIKTQTKTTKTSNKTPQKFKNRQLQDQLAKTMFDKQQKQEDKSKNKTTKNDIPITTTINMNNDNNIRHNKHQVRQSTKSTPMIATDVKTWQYELQQINHSLSSCQSSYLSLQQSFNKTKQMLIATLNKQYDKMQMLLSRKYLQCKQEIAAISESYQKNIQSIICSYKYIRKMLIPNRYPMLFIKHCWLNYINGIVKNASIIANNKETQDKWIKGYEGRTKIILKKFQKNTISQLNINNNNSNK